MTRRTIRRSNRSATMPAGTDSKHVWQDAGGSHDPEQHRRLALRVDDHQDGDQVEPVTDAGDELAGEEPRQGRVAAEELDVGSGQAHTRGPTRGRGCRRPGLSATLARIPLTSNGRQARMLRQDQRDEAGDVRRGEAVAGGDRTAAVLPGDRYVDAPRPELDRRRRVVVDPPGIRLRVRGDREDGGEERRIARRPDVVGRAHQGRAAEVRAVGEVMEDGIEGLALRGQAQVADLQPLLDRPFEPGGERRPLAAQVGPQDADRDDLDLRRKADDDRRRRRSRDRTGRPPRREPPAAPRRRSRR